MGLRDIRKFHWNVTIRNSIGLVWGTRRPALRSAMTRAEEYRLRAKEAEEQANKSATPPPSKVSWTLPGNGGKWPSKQIGTAGKPPGRLPA